jgi:hypothetical protein
MISVIFDIEGEDKFLEEKKYSFKNIENLSAFIRKLNRNKIKSRPMIVQEYEKEEEFVIDEY